ncbi:MAG: TRAP transporter substrate-binding protein [Candidatus Marsarchaeota archaeon]|nr:TRAP transporter substrate-binding protein [Candidatus Marsarchaeota archaeon]
MKRSPVVKYIAIVLLLFCCLAAPGAQAADKVITLKFAHFVPSTTLEGKTMQDWANEVEKRTGGKVKITIYPGATLMPPQQTYDGITKEVADIGYGIFAYHRGRFPLMEVIDLPLGYKNPAVPTKLINELYKKFKPKELDDVKVLFLEAHGPGIMSTKKPVAKLEDVKGMKIRAHGVSARILTALGATPIGLPITDTYDALSKGVVEGLMLDWGGLYNWKMGDVVKNHIDCPGISYTTGFYTVMNKDKWNSLPPDIQATIDKLDEEWLGTIEKKWVDWQAMGKKNLSEKGNNCIVLPADENARWAGAMKQVLAEWEKSTKAKGVPADEALKFCLDYLKAHDQ